MIPDAKDIKYGEWINKLKARIKELEAQSNWVDVKERLPEDLEEEECMEYYLIKIEGYGWEKALYINGSWWTSYVAKVSKNVTHWQEITPPKE